VKAFGLASLALLAFAANSILARLALTETSIDPVSFTAVRLTSGAIVLGLIVAWRSADPPGRGSPVSALALFVYALAFSLAYVSLTAATGALLLFGAVQVSMVGWTLVRGERLNPLAWMGFALALGGLVWLLLPGLARPPIGPAGLMIAAGVAWAVYTLRAKAAGNPTRATAMNFILAAMPALALALILWPWASWDGAGLILAVASGALASGLGYVIWYSALALIRNRTAAVAQLAVPVITALAGVLLLAEPLSVRVVLAGSIILAGMVLVIAPWQRNAAAKSTTGEPARRT
jgi:drug/metabolite transporter (DMT)-like permease